MARRRHSIQLAAMCAAVPKLVDRFASEIEGRACAVSGLAHDTSEAIAAALREHGISRPTGRTRLHVRVAKVEGPFGTRASFTAWVEADVSIREAIGPRSRRALQAALRVNLEGDGYAAWNVVKTVLTLSERHELD